VDDCAVGEAGVEDNGDDLRPALSGSCAANGAFVNVVVAVGIEETGEERTKNKLLQPANGFHMYPVHHQT